MHEADVSSYHLPPLLLQETEKCPHGDFVLLSLIPFSFFLLLWALIFFNFLKQRFRQKKLNDLIPGHGAEFHFK